MAPSGGLVKVDHTFHVRGQHHMADSLAAALHRGLLARVILLRAAQRRAAELRAAGGVGASLRRLRRHRQPPRPGVSASRPAVRRARGRRAAQVPDFAGQPRPPLLGRSRKCA
eukprot:scaffold142_cov315-Prasinococcus_capsulatus_cf.AAC.2